MNNTDTRLSVGRAGSHPSFGFMFPVKQRMMSSVESEEEVEEKLKKSEKDLKQLLWEVEEKTDLCKTREH